LIGATTKSVVLATPADIELEPEPIPQDWILSGAPQARCKKLVRSHDATSSIVVWDCTEGRFNWHFSQDEAIIVVSGEALMINEKGEERRFSAGDLGFFPAGTSCTWQITKRFRKIGILRETMWRPLGLAIKGWHWLMRTIGLGTKSAFLFILAAWILSKHS
jgi:uncharacterized cupin superfamily protein